MKTPNTRATAAHTLRKPGERLDHQESRDLKRERPTNGRVTAETTDMTDRIWRKRGAREAVATSQSEMPNARRTTKATQRPVLDCQREIKETILAGEIRPSTPMPAVKIETTKTIRSAIYLHLRTRRSPLAAGFAASTLTMFPGL